MPVLPQVALTTTLRRNSLRRGVFLLGHDGLASDQGGFRAARFCLALVNRGGDAAWAKSYGSIG